MHVYSALRRIIQIIMYKKTKIIFDKKPGCCWDSRSYFMDAARGLE